MNQDKVNIVAGWLRNIANRPNAINIPISPMDIVNIREGIAETIYTLKGEHPLICEHLMREKEYLFINQMAGYVQITTINPFIVGQILECLDLLSENMRKKSNTFFDVWGYIHPDIVKVSQRLYIDGHYANAAEDAFIEINSRVKKLYKKLNPTATKIPDGDAAMTTVFSPNSPMLRVCDISTDTGMNEQKGLMFMLQGAMSALRNPKAHSNITISKDDAMRRIMYASMLMYKIDDAVAYSKIQE